MKKGSGTKKYLFLVILLIAAVAGVVYVGLEELGIREIIVIGNESYSKDEIIKKSGVTKDQNILKLNKGLVKERIERDPYLEVESVRIRYPYDIEISVREREAAAIVPYLNSYFIIDEKCYIMEIADALETIDYPLVQDMPVKNFVVGSQLVAIEEYQVKVLSRVLESIYSLGIEDRVSEIIMENPEDVYLILTDGIHARIGQAVEMDKKLIWLNSEEIQEVCGGLVGGVLDLTAPSKPVFYPHES